MFQTHCRPAAVAVLLACSSAAMGSVPADIIRKLPQGYKVLTSATSAASPARRFYFVALASRKEVTHQHYFSTRAPARPLLIFQCRDSSCAQVGRNDDVILRADGGGINACDPFEERSIVVKGFYFTVEQGVACGAHWTDFVTFRFDRRSGNYIFDNWRTESWYANPREDPNAEALVSDGQKVVRAKGRRLPFADWRRPD